MDFARKQMEKFGWTEGSGLGKNNQGMLQAIKPTLKTGKEGMGYDFSKELVDTWWTRAYDDSLSRINIDESSETVGVSLKEDNDEDGQKNGEEEGLISKCEKPAVERPFEKMRKRMMKATFTTFSKGAILTNGEMVPESKSKSDSDDSEDDTKTKPKEMKTLTDEQLLKACGGRTAHKAARFGLKLNGKLARIAAQEEAAKALLLSNSQKSQKEVGSSKNLIDKQPSPQEPEICESVVKDKKKKKKKSKHQSPEEACETLEDNTLPVPESTLQQADDNQENCDLEDSQESKKKRKKHKKRKYEELDEPVQVQEDAQIKEEEEISSKKSHKKNKKSKKLSKRDKNEEECALLSS